MTILQDFLLMLLFKKLEDCLFLLLITLLLLFLIQSNNRVLRNSHTKYFLPRVNITNYNVLIDERNFYDQPVNDFVKQYNEIRKTATGQGDDYTTGCLLDYHYFKDHYNIIAVDLSKQKELDADSRAVQQIKFYGMLKTNSQVYTVLEKSKEKMLEFYKGTASSN